jgi:hypothetical protein
VWVFHVAAASEVQVLKIGPKIHWLIFHVAVVSEVQKWSLSFTIIPEVRVTKVVSGSEGRIRTLAPPIRVGPLYFQLFCTPFFLFPTSFLT